MIPDVFILPATTLALSIYFLSFGKQQSLTSYPIDIKVFPEEGALLRGRLLAVVDENVPEGSYGVLGLAQREGLSTDGEVDVILSKSPALPLIHLHGLAVTPQSMSLLQTEGVR